MDNLRDAIRNFEHWYLIRALHENRGNKLKTSKMLGLSYKGLHEALKRQGIKTRIEWVGNAGKKDTRRVYEFEIISAQKLQRIQKIQTIIEQIHTLKFMEEASLI